MRWIAILRDQIQTSLAATSGIHECEDVVKALLVGADVAMLAAGPVCCWWLRPDLVRTEAVFVAIVGGGYATAIVVGYAKYGRLTSYHTRAATLAAYLVGAGAILAIGGGSTWLFRIGAVVVAYAELEEVAISWTLTEWRANVRSLADALEIRRGQGPS